MKLSKIFLLALFSALSLSLLKAQTQVGGGIFADETWTVNGSPYIVVSDVVVFPNITLTIEPGVEIRFLSGNKLELRDGHLIANGTENSRIIFTLDSEDPANDPPWAGIQNNPQTPEPVTIEFNYITLEYATAGINYGSAGTATYRTIDNAVFRKNTQAVFDGGSNMNWITVSNSVFENNGIGMDGRMSAFDCTFSNNVTAFANPMFFNDATEGGRATNCTFSNNNQAIASTFQTQTFAKTDNSVFTDNETAIFVNWAEVSNSMISGSNEVGIFLERGFVDNSTILNNQKGIEIGINASNPTISNNNIGSNTYGIWTNSPLAVFSGNIICGNIEENAYNNSQANVDLTNNCWCLDNPQSIGFTIFDADDDPNFGIIHFEPFIVGCVNGMVFPGDLNRDGISNAWDLLPMGLAFESQGPPRNEASDSWFGQDSDDWNLSFITGLNYKYADANGDGIIDLNDLASIKTNYGNTHTAPVVIPPVPDDSGEYEIRPESFDFPGEGFPFSVNVVLASAANPIPDLYGIAFRISGNVKFFETGSFNLNTSGSWLGNMSNMAELGKENEQEGWLEIGLTKTDFQGASGFGIIAVVDFVMNEDIIAAITDGNDNQDTILKLKIEAIQAYNSEGEELKIIGQPFEVMIETSVNSVSEILAQKIKISPNPANDFISVQSENLDIQKITLFNSTSKPVGVFESDFEKISIGNPSPGLYIMEIQTNEGVCVKKTIFH